MACFLVSAAAAIGTAAVKHVVKHKETKAELKAAETTAEPKEYKFGSEVKWSKKLSYLELSLWSGAFVLAGEHILHGEVTPFPPFLTAAGEGAGAVSEMLHEMGTVGVTMFAAVFAAWAIGTFLVDLFKFRKHRKEKATKLAAEGEAI